VRLTDRGRPLLDSIVADIWASAAPSG
jgi:hypothetical protein